MDDNHQLPPPRAKFVDDCSPNMFALNHPHFSLQQQPPPPPPPPYVFPQQLPAATPTQGFLQYNNNNNRNIHFQTVLLQPPSRRPPQLPLQDHHHHHENVSCSSTTSTYITSPVPRFPLFKADLNENIVKNEGFRHGGSGGGGGGGEDGILRGSEDYVPDNSRRASHSHYGWQNQEDSAIRQPFWKSLCSDISDKAGNEIKDKETEQQQQMQMSSLEGRNAGILFGELEEICRNASVSVSKSNNRDDGSVGTGNGTQIPCLPPPPAAAAAAATNGGEAKASGNDDELPSRIMEDQEMNASRRKKMRDEMSSMAVFFEGLVHQLMEHQENLHRKCMVAIEKLDQERKEREQVWRQNEVERLEQEAALRANERALAAQREASIVSYLEKITGQSVVLPPRNPISMDPQQGISSGLLVNQLSTSNKSRGGTDLSLRMMNKRWPKAEVDALIHIRSTLEKRFQGPGYKGPLWDEISTLMATMGFQRTAKRCKEKWENINKYFKKSRENSNSKHHLSRKKLKTCQYFDQLDQLYSKSSGVVINGSNSCSSSSEHQANPNSSCGNGNGNGTDFPKPQQNEPFIVPAGNLITEAGFNNRASPDMEELKQGNIIKRIDCENQYVVEEMEEDEEAEGDGTDNDNETGNGAADDLCDY